MIFRGEHWDRELWLEWSDMLMGQFWEGVGQPSPDEMNDWNEFRAEWYRALMDGGNESGFVGQTTR